MSISIRFAELLWSLLTVLSDRVASCVALPTYTPTAASAHKSMPRSPACYSLRDCKYNSTLEMSHHTDPSNKMDPFASMLHDPQAVEQLLTLSPPAMRRPLHATDSGANHKTENASSTDAAVTFLASMVSHYKTLSDSVTPHLFAQLSRDYNTRKLDETSFYVAAYRLFFETGATHLTPGLHAFLPATWREVNLDWLNGAVEGDSERHRTTAREAIGELAAMVERRMTGPGTPSVSAAAATEKLDLQASATRPVKHKKRTPTNGFRATYRTVVSDVETPSRPGAPTPSSDSDSRSAYRSSSGNSTSPTFGRLENSSTSPSATKLAHRKSNKAPSSTTSARPRSDHHDGLQAAASSPSSSLPTDKVSKLPPASSITHSGPIYPTTRAIMARSHKPYIHALCGQGFGHPAEIQRHHNGQSGRPGCWEKSGKPVGEEGRWDRHPSCKIKLADLEYVKVLEGWVVTSWGSASVEELLREGAGEVLESGTAKSSGAKAGTEKKRKVVAKPQLASKAADTRPSSANENESVSEEASEDGGEVNGYTEPASLETPGAKRQKILKPEECAASFSEEHAAVRAAALGLRARK
jgi:hypothetical protein